MSGEESQHPYYPYYGESPSPAGYGAACVNYLFSTRTEERHRRRMLEHAALWGSNPRPPKPPQTPAPVYGPSTTPRLHQFVDPSTNHGGMTPFFALQAETPAAARTPPKPTPTPPAPTPSSAMGMTASPAPAPSTPFSHAAPTSLATALADAAEGNANTPAKNAAGAGRPKRRGAEKAPEGGDAERMSNPTPRRGKGSKAKRTPATEATPREGRQSASRSLIEALAAYAHNGSQGGCQKFVVKLLCHGGRTASVLSYGAIAKGTHAIFEGDRGIDLGEVTSCEETNENAGGKNGLQFVVRSATQEEVGEWNGSLLNKEAEALEECRAACEELGLTIDVVGAAFQFDRQKLTFLYESEERVDFRALLQAMFSKFHCRIWMERVNHTV